ncbi:MAG: ATP synthase F0 subunit B [Candidatus Tumulicola sp.]
MFLSLDGTFWVQLFNFAIFFALLNVLFLRPVGQAIRKRREYIDGVVSDYATYQANAKALRERAERVRVEARREAEQRVAKARADASNEAARLASQYAATAQSIVEEAQRSADAELAQARKNEERIVKQLSDIMVERTLDVASR